MSAVVFGTRAYLRDLLIPDSEVLGKLQREHYELAISQEVEKAYQSAFRKHGMAALYPKRRMAEVRDKLAAERKLVVLNSSTIISRTKNVGLTGLMPKYAKFVRLVIASSATHFITYAGQHLATAWALSKQYNIEVLSPDDFVVT